MDLELIREKLAEEFNWSWRDGFFRISEMAGLNKLYPGPWPELEPMIASSPHLAINYARIVIGGPWAPGEAAILSDASIICEYTQFVLRQRWPAGEDALLRLLQDDPDGWSGSVIAYAELLGPSPWTELEKAILAIEPSQFNVRTIGKLALWLTPNTWPAAEEHLLKDPVSAVGYARNNIRGRWPAFEASLVGRADFTSHQLGYLAQYFEHFRLAEDPSVNPVVFGLGPDGKGTPVSQSRSGGPGELDAIFAELDALIGLDGVKQELRRIAAMATVAKRRRDMGKKSAGSSLHLIFAGRPGTGKTTVARLVGKIYQALGLLESGHVVETERSQLVAEYIGQTAVKTKEVIASAMDGVLFIDEAYSLSPPDSFRDFGKEAIDTILVEMENNRDRLAVIAAGYVDEMDRFLNANPGLESRFGRRVEFEDYNPADMLAIFEKMAADHDYGLSDPFREALHTFLDDAYDQRTDRFSNGRFVRNLLERVIERHSLRCMDDPAADLLTLDLADLPEEFPAGL